MRQEIRDLIGSLRGFHGHRTVWIDLGGQLVHAEPDDELEARGFLYVATVLRPSEDELAEAVARWVTVPAAAPASPEPRTGELRWASAAERAQLVPA